ncbi:hypothetical protein GCM10010377_61720 [Streptomyces viridiviolaceus]|nr:hypothetical protein GCM10010377_61720 [Streptomyces viridiviolaceus]
MTSSVAWPAFTMISSLRRRSDAVTNSCGDSVGTKAPSWPNSSIRARVRPGVRLCTATVKPLRARFRAELRPMTASPVTPICADASMPVLPSSGSQKARGLRPRLARPGQSVSQVLAHTNERHGRPE